MSSSEPSGDATPAPTPERDRVGPCDRVGFGRSLVVGFGGAVSGTNRILTKALGLRRTRSRVACHGFVLRGRHRAGMGAATAPGPEADLSARSDGPRRAMAVGQRALPRRVPRPYRRRCVRHRDRGGPLSRRVPDRPGAQPLRFDLRPCVRRPVRDGVSARHGRRSGRHPGPQALRHRELRGRELLGEHCLARGPRSHSAGDARLGRRRRRRTGRAQRRVRTASRRSSGDGVRGRRSAGRDDGPRYPGVPPGPGAHRPRDRRHPRARNRRRASFPRRPRRDARTAARTRTSRCSWPSAPVVAEVSTSRATSSTAYCGPSSSCST